MQSFFFAVVTPIRLQQAALLSCVVAWGCGAHETCRHPHRTHVISLAAVHRPLVVDDKIDVREYLCCRCTTTVYSRR